ncbi:MAG: hypothetical protein HDQ99_14505 [Lachnospiraceae bacterium]|nr:hypothetical protein [Lachnospiraceae bacterium]
MARHQLKQRILLPSFRKLAMQRFVAAATKHSIFPVSAGSGAICLGRPFENAGI